MREIIFRNYRIVYRMTPEQVQVLRFWHAARGTPEISIEEFLGLERLAPVGIRDQDSSN